MKAKVVSAGSVVLVILVLAGVLLAAGQNKTWIDPEVAMREDPDFAVQGEYAGKGSGLRVAALGDGRFCLTRYNGGLPGAGWDGDPVAHEVTDREGVRNATRDAKKIERTSPTLGARPPEGAMVLFDGKVRPPLRGEARDGILWEGAKAPGPHGDFRLHLEFRVPYRPKEPLSSQDRGNSGVYLLGRYEVQILDSFGLVCDREQAGIPLKSNPKQWVASLYKFKAPDIPMAYPPLRWQTYDITFRAPRFDADGKKIANAVVTVLHNGVKVHDAVELPKGTGRGGWKREVAAGPILFQDHGEPVAFRNIWLVEERPAPRRGGAGPSAGK